MNNKALLYAPLQKVMRKCGTTLSPQDFYWAVNLAYHSVESSTYTTAHAPMIKALPVKWKELLSPLRQEPSHQLRWLDIGCGPGVLGDIFNNLVGTCFEKAVFLDPSPEMIDQCRKASVEWTFESHFVVGTIDDLIDTEQFDVITANSVLHHVVELESLCNKVASMVKPSGYFMTCFDPRMEAAHDTIFQRRHFFYEIIKKSNRGLRKVSRIIMGHPVHPSQYEAETNAKLLDSGVINQPLSIHEIWAVTDFHVPGQPSQIGDGISIERLKKFLYPLKLDEYFTYQYFGEIEPITPFLWIDNLYNQRNDPHGQLFGARWHKPTKM